ncbi:MAG: ABC transporter permease [Candidatus Omnitrophica bacterium]|nr:ABC transporter permease [Candidatus Omnitrophota bacterium]
MDKERFKKIYAARRILLDIALRQFKAKYAGSRLGIWWALVTPLLLAASINVVFKGALKIGIPHYTFFVLAGLLPWFFFSNALLESVNSFQSNASVMRQSVFPREFIPAGTVLANLFTSLIGFICLLPFFFMMHPAQPWFCLYLIPVIFLHFVFVTGLGLFFSTASVFFRDLAHFLNIFFMVWFWMTPVFYTMDMIPFPYRWMMFFNPVSYYTAAYQRILVDGGMPPVSTLLVLLLSAGVSFLGGYSFFLNRENALLKKI